jgi:hypothetical protein
MIGTAPLPQARCSLYDTTSGDVALLFPGSSLDPLVPRDPAELGRVDHLCRCARRATGSSFLTLHVLSLEKAIECYRMIKTTSPPQPPQPVNPPHHYVAHSYLASQRASLHNTTSGQIASRTRLKAIMRPTRSRGLRIKPGTRTTARPRPSHSQASMQKEGAPDDLSTRGYRMCVPSNLSLAPPKSHPHDFHVPR